MREDIVEKLRTVLNEPFDECRVVYILAETRKLLDKYPPQTPLFALRLYCHWALHIDLTHPKTTENFLHRVDDFMESALAGTTDIVLEHRMFREFVFWDTFRAELRSFMNSYDLPLNICDDEYRWHEFLEHYAAVVEDGSLSCRSTATKFKFIEGVQFSKGNARHDDSYIPFDLRWTVSLKDGRKVDVEVYAAPALRGQMIGHGITLR
jgi:hypothetical protein